MRQLRHLQLRETETMSWKPVGKYAIRDGNGYTISKTFSAGRVTYSGWAPGDSRAFIHAGDAAPVKAACIQHHEERNR